MFIKLFDVLLSLNKQLIDIPKIELKIINDINTTLTNTIIGQNDAIKELNELFALEQEVPVYTVSIDALEGVDFTAGQMEALLFMIED